MSSRPASAMPLERCAALPEACTAGSPICWTSRALSGSAQPSAGMMSGPASSARSLRRFSVGVTMCSRPQREIRASLQDRGAGPRLLGNGRGGSGCFGRPLLARECLALPLHGLRHALAGAVRITDQTSGALREIESAMDQLDQALQLERLGQEAYAPMRSAAACSGLADIARIGNKGPN